MTSYCFFYVLCIKLSLEMTIKACRHQHLVVRNSMSLFVFSSILLEATSSSTSCEISGRLLLLPPRLRLDDVEEELRPESGTGDAWHSRRKSTHPPEQRKIKQECDQNRLWFRFSLSVTCSWETAGANVWREQRDPCFHMSGIWFQLAHWLYVFDVVELTS